MAAAVPALIEEFLAPLAARTVRAYLNDLDEFARVQGRERVDAIADLLAAGAVDGHRVVVSFAAQLERCGRSAATVDRRLGTLRSLVRAAAERELVDWSLSVHDWSAMVGESESMDEGVPYVLPRHPAEADRLDLQHYALLEALRGHHLAPVWSPRRVLDVGAGTGQWGYDLCETHEEALVVGFDLVLPKPGAPEGYRAVRGDLLEGLPFESDSFDFVHQRLLFAGVPVEAWPDAVAELVRVCCPGGWVELVEGATRSERMGPAMEQLVELLLELNRAKGLDTDSVVFRSLGRYLVDAGLDQVDRRTVELPLGDWAGRVGSLMATDVRALFTRLSAAFAVRLGVPATECMRLVRAAQVEWEELHTTYSLAVAWGRKAGGGGRSRSGTANG
jgi:SAM-dependent methyltransferase